MVLNPKFVGWVLDYMWFAIRSEGGSQEMVHDENSLLSDWKPLLGEGLV